MRAINKRYRDNHKGLYKSKLFFAYLAGIVDGEGSLGLYIHKQPLAEHKLGYMYQPQIVIVNTELKMLQYIEANVNEKLDIKPGLRQFERIGGFITSTKGGKYSIKPVYELRFRSMWQVKRLIDAIHPYLVSKKEIAGLIAQFCELRLNRKRHKAPYGEEEVHLYNQIRLLSPRSSKRLMP